jgi:hypothetical protein
MGDQVDRACLGGTGIHGRLDPGSHQPEAMTGVEFAESGPAEYRGRVGQQNLTHALVTAGDQESMAPSRSLGQGSEWLRAASITWPVTVPATFSQTAGALYLSRCRRLRL